MRKVVLAVVLALMTSGAQAVTLNVVGGQLMGASDVLVDGSFYDVQFLDGTCIDLFNGCDEASDFTFQTEASATLAALALQWSFVNTPAGQFDDLPQATNGCTNGNGCKVVTPWHIALGTGWASHPDDSTMRGVIFFNDALHSRWENYSCGLFGYNTCRRLTTYSYDRRYSRDHVAGSGNLRPDNYFDSAADTTSVYAVWTPVPEPSTALLMGLGLTGLAAKGRRRS